MNIVVVSDHAGFTLKEDVKTFLESEGHNVIDCGTYSKESCDYPDYANTAALAILEGKAERGIFICGTGIGISIAANRHKGIRAGLCHNSLEARLTREHNDANILCLGGRMIGKECALENVKVFLTTNFAGGRHTNRIKKLDN